MGSGHRRIKECFREGVLRRVTERMSSLYNSTTTSTMIIYIKQYFRLSYVRRRLFNFLSMSLSRN